MGQFLTGVARTAAVAILAAFLVIGGCTYGVSRFMSEDAREKIACCEALKHQMHENGYVVTKIWNASSVGGQSNWNVSGTCNRGSGSEAPFDASCERIDDGQNEYFTLGRLSIMGTEVALRQPSSNSGRR